MTAEDFATRIARESLDRIRERNREAEAERARLQARVEELETALQGYLAALDAYRNGLHPYTDPRPVDDAEDAARAVLERGTEE